MSKRFIFTLKNQKDKNKNILRAFLFVSLEKKLITNLVEIEKELSAIEIIVNPKNNLNSIVYLLCENKNKKQYIAYKTKLKHLFNNNIFCYFFSISNQIDKDSVIFVQIAKREIMFTIENFIKIRENNKNKDNEYSLLFEVKMTDYILHRKLKNLFFEKDENMEQIVKQIEEELGLCDTLSLKF